MDLNRLAALRDPTYALAQLAGEAILEVYRGDFEVRLKADASPVTEADLRSHHILEDGLRKLLPDVPVLSEEQTEIPFEERRSWPRFWLVDPLDGTREFVGRSGEFCINVALVQGGVPVFGLVHVPVLALSYVGIPGIGAFRRQGDGAWEAVRVAAPVGRRLVVVRSRSSGDGRLGPFLQGLAADWDVEEQMRGSALKACLVADGQAHLYPRIGPTSEWDTAAPQAVLEAAGGAMRQVGSEQPLRYNKPSLLNPPFYAAWGAEAPHP